MVISALQTLPTKILQSLPAEFAHNLAVNFMKFRQSQSLLRQNLDFLGDDLEIEVPGLGLLKHPLGLAAGFDKNAEIAETCSTLGFSFLELGTVTPQPQLGNPKPRLFRIRDQLSLINRMGFNSLGLDVFEKNLNQIQTLRENKPIGTSIGKNKDTPSALALEDLLSVKNRISEKSSFLVINLSSPNTPGLRELAGSVFLQEISSAFQRELQKTWIKLDPDRPRREFIELIEVISSLGFAGVVLTNTHSVVHPHKGGLSGASLAAAASSHLELAYSVHKGNLPMIAVGGIFSGYDLFERMRRGACAGQIYTALVYRGPSVVAKILTEFKSELNRQGYKKPSEIIGSHYLG